MKSFDDYQKKALLTDKYPKSRKKRHVDAIIYSVLGLTGEAGEAAEKIKKLLRDKKGVIDDEAYRLIVLELGDVLWYVAHASSRLGLPLSEVARLNIEKLASRQRRGKIRGSGDRR